MLDKEGQSAVGGGCPSHLGMRSQGRCEMRSQSRHGGHDTVWSQGNSYVHKLDRKARIRHLEAVKARVRRDRMAGEYLVRGKEYEGKSKQKLTLS